MSFVFPLEPQREGARGHSEADDFAQIRTCLNKENPSADDYAQAVRCLEGLLNELHAGNAISIELLYKYIVRLLPHFDEEQFCSFCNGRLSLLLKKSTDFHEEHRQLALELGHWKLSHPRDATFGGVLQASREAMDFYVEAIAIAEEHQLEVDETHRQSSAPFTKILKGKLGHGAPIKTRLLDASRAWQSDPERFFLCYASIERLVEKLQYLCCDREGEETIKEIYRQSLEALNRTSDEFKSQPRFVQGNYFQRLRVKLDTDITRPKRWPTQRYRDHLKEFRKHFSACSCDNVREFQEENSQKFITMFQEVYFHDIEAIFLDALPGRYDVRAMGSFGKKEGCPSSDLEYLIFIEDEKDREVYLHVAELLELQLTSLGETPLSTRSMETLRRTLPLPIKKGFHVDGLGNPAQQSDVLIRTPARMAELQLAATEGPASLENTTRKSMSLKNSEGVSDDSALYELYKQCLEPILDPDGKPSLRQKKAMLFMMRRLEAYGQMPPPFAGTSQEVDLKLEFIEPLFHLISDMAFYWGVSGNNTLDLIEELSQKGLFSAQSKELLLEAISMIYSMRVTLLGPSRWFNEKERDQLEKVYWLVLRPLYTTLKRCIEIRPYPDHKEGRDKLKRDPNVIYITQSETTRSTFVRKLQKFEDIFNEVNLTAVAFNEIFDFPEKAMAFKTLISQWVSYRVQKKVFSDEDYFATYKTLSKMQQLEPLREVFLEALSQLQRNDLVARLESVPNPAGDRQITRKREEQLQTALRKMTTKTKPQSGQIVQVRGGQLGEERYLRPEVAGQILENGHVKHVYDSAHDVAPATWKAFALHFKEVPNQPANEDAVWDLTSRIGGDVTTPSELLSFEVEGQPDPCPVQVSLTTEGNPLSKVPEDQLSQIDIPQWTRLLLCAILTLPGDGRRSNYIRNDRGMLRCVDNESVFAEPVVKEWLVHTVVQFYCVLFLLLPENTPLDVGVLEEFCELDFDAVLASWIDRAIKREQRYRNLFLEQLPKLYHAEDPKKLFTPNLLFREGALATLNLQCIILKNYIRKSLDEKQPVYARHLLSLLQSQRQEAVGSYVAKAYSQAMSQPTLELRMQTAVGAQRGASLSASESLGAALGKVPSLEEIEKRTSYPPEKAREELFSVLLQRCSQHAQLVLREDEFAIRADFREMVDVKGPDRFRQRLVVKALIAQSSCTHKKLSTVILRNCAILDGDLLAPLLSADLQILDVSGCPVIVDADIVAISQRCPNLKELYLSGCSRLRSVDPYFSQYLLFPHLVSLHANNCARLAIVGLHAPFLRTLECKHNPSLRNIYLKTRNWAKINMEGSPAHLDRSYPFAKKQDFVIDKYPIYDFAEFSKLQLFACASKSGISLRDSQTGIQVRTLHTGPEATALLARTETILLGAIKTRITCWDVTNGNVLWIHNVAATSLALLQHNKYGAINGNIVRILGGGSLLVKSGKIEEKNPIHCLAIYGESVLYSTLHEIKQWKDHETTVVCVPPNGVETFAVTSDGTIIIQNKKGIAAYKMQTASYRWSQIEYENPCYNVVHKDLDQKYTGFLLPKRHCILLNQRPLILSDNALVYATEFSQANYMEDGEEGEDRRYYVREVPVTKRFFLRMIDLETGATIKTCELSDIPTSLSKFHDDRILWCSKGKIQVWSYI